MLNGGNRSTARCHTRSHGNDGIIIPLHPPHFGAASRFLWSYCALVVDPGSVQIGYVMSSRADEDEWHGVATGVLRKLKSVSGTDCALNWTSAHWQQMQQRVDGWSAPLPRLCQPPKSNRGCGEQRYNIQTVKKYYALLFWSFERALVLDAEARVLKRMSARRLFEAFHAAPSYWFSRHLYQAFMRPLDAISLGAQLSGKLWGQVDSYRRGMGVPWASYFIDVAHWFYHIEWLRSLVAHLRAVHGGSLVQSLCQGYGCSLEAKVSFAFLYNRSAVGVAASACVSVRLLEPASCGQGPLAPSAFADCHIKHACQMLYRRRTRAAVTDTEAVVRSTLSTK